MLATRLGPIALIFALASGCGEVAGEPIVAISAGSAGSSPLPGGTGAGGATSGSGSSAPAGGADDTAGGANPGSNGNLVGPTGLCGACSSSDECSDANDACIHQQALGYCGRDCDEHLGCPDGYSCAQIDGGALWQCVPIDGCPLPEPSPALADVRAYVLGLINAVREDAARSPLIASSCLERLAEQSAIEYARTDEPLGKFVTECESLLPDCECGWQFEMETSFAARGLDWRDATTQLFAEYANGREDRFSEALLAASTSQVGIGFWLSGDEAWLALSFK